MPARSSHRQALGHGNSNLAVVLGDTSIADASADDDNFAAGFATVIRHGAMGN